MVVGCRRSLVLVVFDMIKNENSLSETGGEMMKYVFWAMYSVLHIEY